MNNENYYKILGVSYSATQGEIKNAFRNLAKKYHPDVNQSNEAIIMMQKLTEAYDTLSDENKKRRYDLEMMLTRINSEHIPTPTIKKSPYDEFIDEIIRIYDEDLNEETLKEIYEQIKQGLSSVIYDEETKKRLKQSIKEIYNNSKQKAKKTYNYAKDNSGNVYRKLKNAKDEFIKVLKK